MTRGQSPGFASDAAISSTIGMTVLLLSAVVSGGAVYASVSGFGFDDETTPRLFDVESSQDTHQVRMRAGEAVHAHDARIIVTADGATSTSSLDEFHAPALEDGAWSVDETVCIIGPGTECLFRDGYAIDVQVIAKDMLVFDGGGTLQPGGTPGGYTLLPGESFGSVDDGRVTVCHKPGTNAEQTKDLPHAALHGHTGHGDVIGACGLGGGDDGKLVICHKDDLATLTIPYAAWAAHAAHGDAPGTC